MQDQILVKKKKKLLSKEISFDNLDTHKVAQRLIEIMKNHVGERRRISRIDLFYLVYGVSINEVNTMKREVMCDYMLKARHLLRQRTRCQIVCRTFKVNDKQKMYYFFVASNDKEAGYYKTLLKKAQKAMDKAMDRMERSVEEGWYAQPDTWVLKERGYSIEDEEIMEAETDTPEQKNTPKKKIFGVF
jgi:hypothetical protein